MEPVDQRPNSNETPAGSFGLGAALAVAYDLIEDPSFPCVYSEAGGSAATGYNAVQSPFTTVLTPPNQTGGFLLTNASSDRLKTAGYYSLPVAAVSQSQQPIQQQPNRYPLPAWNTAATATTTSTLQPFWVSDRTTGMSSVYSAAGPPMTAYLNPIPTTPGLQTSSEAPPCSTSASTLSPSVSVPSSASLYYSTDISTQHSYLGNGPASESTLSTDSLISNRSDSYNSDGYTLKPIPCPAAAVVPSAATGSVPSSSPVPRKSNHPDAHKHSNGPSSSSTTSDDGLYELSEEDVKEIDDMFQFGTNFGVHVKTRMPKLQPLVCIERPPSEAVSRLLRVWAHWLTGRRTRLRAPQHDLAPIMHTPGFTNSGDMKEPSPSDSQSTGQPLDTQHILWANGVVWCKRQTGSLPSHGF
ncbi:unnamed protein product [Schistocephalus solidus]|uniref:C2H2-type domain-containing protein n=1 Tax=Schistocephalus solidus TaxID=70667 RepID=A0A183TED7_SCHSO|nr:unnamed protein product [Schistocephalus solidus]